LLEPPDLADREAGTSRQRSDQGAPALVILIPLFNDWPALAKLLPRLDSVLAEHGLRADLLVVDDGSTERPSEALGSFAYRALERVCVLELRRNLGHQRAIAIGLAYLEARTGCEAVVVMDADGEDDPQDVPRLIEHSRREGGTRIVFAERTRRSESLLFRVFYVLFRILHRLLTGHGVRVGNFSLIPRVRLASLVVVSEMWSHYAAAAFVSRQPRTSIPTRRAPRLDGRSSLGFTQLVTHGLRAIAVFRELAGVRMLVAGAALTALALLGIAASAALEIWGSLRFPGWEVTLLGLFVALFVQAVLFAFFLTFVLLSDLSGAPMLPSRDYAFFVGSLTTLFTASNPAAAVPRAQ
jgi:hypothetical protein